MTQPNQTSEEKKKVGEILKTWQKRFIKYEGFSIILTIDYSSETMENRRQWNGVFKVFGVKGEQRNKGNLSTNNSVSVRTII